MVGFPALWQCAGHLGRQHPQRKRLLTGLQATMQPTLTARNNNLQRKTAITGLQDTTSPPSTARNNTCEGTQQTALDSWQKQRAGTTGRQHLQRKTANTWIARSRAVPPSPPRHNTCEGNRDGGISLFGSAQGTLEGNTLQRKRLSRIAGNEQSTLTASQQHLRGEHILRHSALWQCAGARWKPTPAKETAHRIAGNEQSTLTRSQQHLRGGHMTQDG